MIFYCSSSPPTSGRIFTPREWNSFKKGFRSGAITYSITLFGGAGLTGFFKGATINTPASDWGKCLIYSRSHRYSANYRSCFNQKEIVEIRRFFAAYLPDADLTEPDVERLID